MVYDGPNKKDRRTDSSRCTNVNHPLPESVLITAPSGSRLTGWKMPLKYFEAG
jgi:hypothetical protein